MPHRILSPLYRLIYIVRGFFDGVFRRSKLGVLSIVVRDGKILLVRPSYRPFWEFPGGLVEPDESLEEGGRREAFEEAGVRIDSYAYTLGVYRRSLWRRDATIAVLVAKDAANIRTPETTYEILDVREFSLDALPKEMTRPMRARIAEYLSGKRDLEGRWET